MTLEHDLGHALAVGLGVERVLSEQDGVLLGGNTEFVVEGVMPDLLHIVPVGEYSCTNAHEIADYLRSLIAPTPTTPTTQGTWRVTHGFRRAFCYHRVVVDETGQVGFHVADDQCPWSPDERPNCGVYESFDEMINGVSEMYADKWNLATNVGLGALNTGE